MLNSPLTQLRKAAPHSLTVKDVVRHFARERYPRIEQAIGAFERGLVKDPEERFFEVYALAIGVSVEEVKRVHRLTLRWRKRRVPQEARVA